MKIRRFAFTMVELLVVIAIIGVLIGLLLPAVQAARESSRRVECITRLRELGFTAALFHDAYQAFPPARLQSRPDDETQCGGKEASWMVRILPYLEQDAVFERWNLYSAWYDHDEVARNPGINHFLCPSRRDLRQATVTREVATRNSVTKRASCGCTFTIAVDGSVVVSGIACDFAANHGDMSPGATGDPTDFYFGGNGTGVIITSRPVCEDGKPIGWQDRIASHDVEDGLSHTFLVGEKHIMTQDLQQFPADSPAFDGDYLPAFARLSGPGVPLARGPWDDTTSGISFGSAHPEICNFALADGSVRSLSTATSTRVLGAYARRSDGTAESRSHD